MSLVIQGGNMLRAAAMLTISNVFMTFAWYGHLRYTGRAIWLLVMASWGIAFFEYCFQVPANRIGYAAGMSGAELKTLQEVITLVVFVAFAASYLREPIRWSTIAGFVLIAAGAVLVYSPGSEEPPRKETSVTYSSVALVDTGAPGLVEGARAPDPTQRRDE